MTVTRFAQNDLVRLSYAVSGDPDRPAVVLLHGLLLDRTSIRPLEDALADDYRVITPDLRGHGASSATTDRRLTITDLANDLVAILDQEDVGDPVAIVGYGLGGAIALELAHWRPDRIANLVLIEPDVLANGRHSGRQHDRQEAADLAYKQQIDKALTLLLNPDWGDDWRTLLPKPRVAAIRRHVASLAPILTALDGFRIAAGDLTQLTAPVTVITAETTPVPLREAISTLASWLPEARSIEVESITGGIPFADNEPLLDAIANAIRSHEANQHRGASPLDRHAPHPVADMTRPDAAPGPDQ